MSIFDELKTLTVSTPRDATQDGVAIRFAEREGALFVLFSDLWALSNMAGDKAATIGLYVRSRGTSAPRHFIFNGPPPTDALVSRDVARRMVDDWCADRDDTIFSTHPIEAIFDEATHAVHGLALIRAIFENVPPQGAPSGFDVVAKRLEVDRIARTVLTHRGRPGSGFPSLTKSEERLLAMLTMSANDAHRASKVHHYCDRFFRFTADDVFDRVPHRSRLST